ncbi:iron chelate uptake ABC transporter family permease subunit [Streptomyces sp. BE20]|uniref:FecCD family ABC transporter permease n=1 Tax=Streptomycetaceae TaxID=2062 RepID=UPI002E775003|nr:iron chelate uptake ABC transporter family permease subunit [Streptomyces sp. BE20]MEE1824741.1 iron chelate uptake ABC transporter family permease subunit [Streptomyces sp. BE20]
MSPLPDSPSGTLLPPSAPRALPAPAVPDPARLVPGLRIRLGPLQLRVARRPLVAGCGLALALLTVAVVTLGTGDFQVSPVDVVKALAGQGTAATDYVVNSLRLPRLAVGLIVGAALGLSGAVFQSLARNPLGSPDLIGFETGAATGALLQILVFGGGPFAVALGAVGGGFATALTVYLLAYRRGVQGYRLIVVGIAAGALLSSVNAYLMIEASIDEAQAAAVWLTGSLNGRGWDQFGPAALAIGLLLPAVLLLGRHLRLMEAGDDAAKALGVPVERSRALLVVSAVLLSAVATASAGPISFVALAAPQLARRLGRAAGVSLLPSALMGALLLCLSDLAAQRVVAPIQLPVGIMTAAIGGLYLVWLLLHEWRSGRR